MSNEGVQAALKLWVVFLLLFFVLGYPAVFSVMLGAIAALAGGNVVTYWTTKDQTPPKTTRTEQQEEGPIGLRERTQIRKQRRERSGLQPEFLRRLFPRKQLPTFRSRRQQKS